ncbi:four-helix bundle copper-binding protein [Polluticoccus soli]|uniref:four-helix bundle copper-binding protein n=1 Tax=Polluticoccus soli TaxID=3034150 RepID=UPI0023E14933|nr:four-helix bundle copper-binding protein [Flavipsychrobacter sp. JY13-12]
MLGRCIRLDLDCAKICEAALGYVSRRSEFTSAVIKLCAEICLACSQECRKHSHQMEHCKRCADACEACAAACNQG